MIKEIGQDPDLVDPDTGLGQRFVRIDGNKVFVNDIENEVGGKAIRVEIKERLGFRDVVN